MYISDQHGLPLDDDEEYVVNLWYASDDQEISAKLKGAKEGVKRRALWDELNKFIIEEGKEEGDDEEPKK